MKNRTAIRWVQNPLWTALLLAAFCSRALIPAGFMPGPGGLIICPGHTPDAATTHNMSAMDMSGMDMSDMDMSGIAHHGGQPSTDGGPQDHEGSSLCPFAAAATTMASGHSAVLVTVVAVESGSVQLPDQPFVPSGTSVPTRLPRGPPAFPS